MARPALATVFGLLGAATRAAAVRERFGKLSELNLECIQIRQFFDDGIQFRRGVTEKIKVQSFPVKQLFDVNQNGGQLPCFQQRTAGLLGSISILLETSRQEIIFHRHAAQKLTVDQNRANRGGGQYFANFESAHGPTKDSLAPIMVPFVDCGKNANFPKQPDSYKVIQHVSPRRPIDGIDSALI